MDIFFKILFGPFLLDLPHVKHVHVVRNFKGFHNVLVNNETKEDNVIHTAYWYGKDNKNSTVGTGTYYVHLRLGEIYKTVKVCFVN